MAAWLERKNTLLLFKYDVYSRQNQKSAISKKQSSVSQTRHFYQRQGTLFYLYCDRVTTKNIGPLIRKLQIWYRLPECSISYCNWIRNSRSVIKEFNNTNLERDKFEYARHSQTPRSDYEIFILACMSAETDAQTSILRVDESMNHRIGRRGRRGCPKSKRKY